MRYYKDPEKLTFDDAEELVERYIREHVNRRNRVTCKDIAVAYDIKESHHNLIRITDALDARLEVARQSGSRATQFKL